MNFGKIARNKMHFLAMLAAAFMVAIAPSGVAAQDVSAPASTVDAAAEGVADGEAVTEETGGFEHFGADRILGQPVSAEEDFWGSMQFQPQHTENGDYALWMHDYILIPVIFGISILVLFLLLWVVARYRRAANQVPSKTSHNALIEFIWTVIPIGILVLIAIPSITLLSDQYQAPPEDAITIKANGYQWYWGYEYLDNGGFEVVSNMLDESEALSAGEPFQLAVDNRMVVPVGVPIRLQTFGADVIHAFAVPSLWFKMDAVPGRINEQILLIEDEGIYYGQCMELCGARHGYMPIAVEARSLEDYNAWVASQPGGMTRAQIEAEEAAAAALASAAEPVAEEGAAAVEEDIAVEASEGA